MSDETRAVPTSADIEAIRQRAEQATPGPWSHWGQLVACEAMDVAAWPYADLPPAEWDGGEDQWNLDAEFIAHARTDVPALLAVLDGERRHRADLERQLEEARELIAFAKDLADDAWHYGWDHYMDGWTDRRDAFRESARAWLGARQVVQEAEAP